MVAYIYLLIFLICNININLHAGEKSVLQECPLSFNSIIKSVGLENTVNNSFAAIQLASTLGSSALAAAAWTYNNPKKTIAAAGVSGAASIYACIKAGRKITGTGGKIIGITLSAYLIYRYLADEELKNMLISSTNAVLAALAQAEERIRNHLELKMNELKNQIAQATEDIKKQNALNRQMAIAQLKDNLKAIKAEQERATNFILAQQQKANVAMFAQMTGLLGKEAPPLIFQHEQYKALEIVPNSEISKLEEQIRLLEEQYNMILQENPEEIKVVPQTFENPGNIFNRISKWWNTGVTDEEVEKYEPPIVSPFGY